MITQNSRPISPHVQIYRLPLTALLSITHRMTGVVLSFGAADGLDPDQRGAGRRATPGLQPFAWYGQMFSAGIHFALYFHFCAICFGISVGTLNSDAADRNAILTLVVAAALTLVTGWSPDGRIN